MGRKIFSLIFIAVGICFTFLIYGTQDIYPLEDKKKTADKLENRIVIAHTEIFGKLERPQVVFDHGKHSDAFKKEGCETCHPANKEGNLIFEYPFKQVMKDKESMMNPYHEKCINCHKKRVKEKKKGGPLICGDCHRKELESIKIKYPIFEFDFYYHRKHVKKLKNDCILCHHIYDEKDEELVYEEGTEQSCYYCHADNPSPIPPPQGEGARERVKRGPSFATEARVIDKKGLTIKKVSHLRCLNCHIDRNKRGLKAGLLVCSKCHTGKYKTVAELAKITRPDREQPEKPLKNPL